MGEVLLLWPTARLLPRAPASFPPVPPARPALRPIRGSRYWGFSFFGTTWMIVAVTLHPCSPMLRSEHWLRQSVTRAPDTSLRFDSVLASCRTRPFAPIPDPHFVQVLELGHPDLNGRERTARSGYANPALSGFLQNSAITADFNCQFPSLERRSSRRKACGNCIIIRKIGP
jgi:hypothetical protein